MKNNNKGRLLASICATMSLLASFSMWAKPDSVDEFVQEVMQQKHIPGLQLAVVKGGKVVKKGNYGYADLQHKVPVQDATLFPINSMTKAFTGVAIMQLAEQGHLNVNDEIGKHLPELPERWHTLKITQLMGHTTGLPRILSSTVNVDTIVHRDAEASWQEVQKRDFLFTPNSRFSYNQTGYVILGKLIDKYVPEGFPAYITKQQLKPTGMVQTADAGFDYLERMVPNQARQYLYLGNGEYQNFYGEFPYMLRTAAGMSTTASELAKYIVALEQGELVQDIDTLWQPVRLNNGRTEGFSNLENGYALGFQVIQRKYHRAVSASGGNAVTLITYPDDDVSIVVLTNLIGSLPIEFVDDIAAFYIPDFNDPSKRLAFEPGAYLLKLTEKQGFDDFASTFAQAQADTGVMIDLEILVEWGNKLLEKNRVMDAIAVFKFAISQNDEQTYYLSSLAEAYEVLEQFKEAKSYYQRILDINPHSKSAKARLSAIEEKLAMKQTATL
ncbi:serine hydrolase [Pseudoalteromonas sp. YIC-656]|uniref:serine hydrolase n=1 Tax=Pseudoalteromonas pernae TaxID=3118054 RepID=UPI00324297F2